MAEDWDAETYPDVFWLLDPRAQDVSRTGGKASMLARLANRYPIPPGFAVAAEPLDPGRLKPQVAAALARLDGPVAVRSSALQEDGRTASFAGQYDTFLNLSTVDEVWDALVRCQSGDAGGASSYRSRHGLSADGVPAVLVQRLIPADVSAVAFSIDPVTGEDAVVIQGTYGLGEALVSGRVSPDTFHLQKGREKGRDTAAITRVDLGDKAEMAIRDAAGARLVAVPRRLRDRPCLNADMACALAAMVLRLEAELQFPVDVEAAWWTDQWHLLQCRPVTAHPAPV